MGKHVERVTSGEQKEVKAVKFDLAKNKLFKEYAEKIENLNAEVTELKATVKDIVDKLAGLEKAE